MPTPSFNHSNASQPQPNDPHEINPAYRRVQERDEARIALKMTLANVARCMQENGANARNIKETVRGTYLYLKTTRRCELPPISTPLLPSTFYVPPLGEEDLLHYPIPGMFTVSQYSPRPTEWLWPGRIPLGALTLLEAAPGSGASLLSLTLAAHVSRGLPFPDYSPCPQGRVLLIAHDHAFTTITPRLLAAGADLTQISLLPTVEDLDSSCADIIDRSFSIAHDLDLLSRAIRQLNPALVILDTQEPFSSAHYRDHLPKLNRLAELAGCAILLIRPTSRPPTLSTMRNLTACGSSPALLHLVRSVLRLIPSFDDDSCYLISTKHALTAQPLDLPFLISSMPASSFIPALCSSPAPAASESAQLPPEDLACFYAPGLPVIRWLPPNIGWPPPQGANALPAIPASLSAIRQDILACLEESPRILSIPEIVEQIDHGYDAVRRALSRMRSAGEVVSPSRGLYTTPEHPCLATSSKSSSPHKHHSPQPSQPSQSPQPSDPIQSSSSAHDLISSSPTPQSTPVTQVISIDIAPQLQQRQPFESVQPSQSSQSIQPSQPSEPVQLSQSSQSVEPSQPTEPVQSSEPVQPFQLSQSQHPSRQDESQLFESIQPSQSFQPDPTISGASSHEPPSPDSTSSAP